jgi:murein DD-endopeptidase MepM/ murein hydrolase activator NlpD
MDPKKILVCYPFTHPEILLIEGFSAYDGNLGDEIDAPHKGIDYVMKRADQYLSFEVFSMHDGFAHQGLSETWGRFVIVACHPYDKKLYQTVYAHLDDIDAVIPLHAPKEAQGVMEYAFMKAGERLGIAGISGATNSIVQLHVELHQKSLETGKIVKLDPYSIYDRWRSGKYPQPGKSLAGLDHYWQSDLPPLGYKP